MCGSSWENMVKAWGNHWETKTWEKHGEVMAKLRGNHVENMGKIGRKSCGKSWEKTLGDLDGTSQIDR